MDRPRGNHQKPKPKEIATATSHWNPKVTPDRHVLEGFTLKEKQTENLRNLGFTTAHVVPSSGIFRGQSALIHLGDWSPSSIIK